MEEQLILVNAHDEPLGVAGKEEVHRKGLLHRAFSIMIRNNRGELLLQKRAGGKYHSSGLWTNSCCSHPRPGEDTEAAAHRRLREEMGFDCRLEHLGSFIYKVQFAADLYEHELDHVFTGTYQGDPVINQEEVSAYRWIALPELLQWMEREPAQFTFWLPEVIRFFYT